MNFKRLIVVFLLILFNSFNLMGQEIKMNIEKSIYNIDEYIVISYHIESHIDSSKIETRYFKKLYGSSERSKSGKDTSYQFTFKALKSGTLKIPKLIVFSGGKKIQSEDLFIEIVGKESSEDLKFIEYKIGHTFTINLPDYMIKAYGLNDYSEIEYKSEKKDVYGYVVSELKEDMGILPVSYSVKPYNESIIEGFMIKEEGRKVSKPQYLKKGNISFVETDMTVFDKEKNKTFYFFIGIAETNKAFYRFISWSSEQDHDIFKRDFQTILYSIKE